MCVKNMNVATEFYDSDLSEYAGLAKFGKVIESVNAEKRDGKYYIDQLTVATFICAMSSSKDPDLIKRYNVRWTFGKVNPDEDGKDSFQFLVVADAVFNPQRNRKEKQPQAICRHFSNQLFKFTLRDYEVEIGETDDDCDYYLKVFLREENEKTWILQSMNFIRVNFC